MNKLLSSTPAPAKLSPEGTQVWNELVEKQPESLTVFDCEVVVGLLRGSCSEESIPQFP